MAKRKQKTYYDQMKEEILAFFSVNIERPYTLTDLYNHYDVYSKQEKMQFSMLVEELVEEGKLYQIGRGKYTVDTTKNAITGRVDHVNPRFAFIRHDDTQPDIYINGDDLKGAIDGDLVKVMTYGTFYKRGENPEGRVIEIVERGRKEVVGKIQTFGNYALVRPDHKNLHEDIFIPKDKINGANKNDLVIVRINEYPTNIQQAVGEVIEVLGKAGENNAEMHAILAEFGLPVHFPAEIEEFANQIPEKISEEEIKKRRDFREILTFTIDPADAKDFDDALSFKVLENGNYEIGVHIADVTHYVQEGTILEEEALRRATSVYLVDRTIPMLPEKLSNNLCSLRPNEDKLTFSAVFEMNDEGKIFNQWFGRTIIHSDKRFTYEEAQEEIENYELRIMNYELDNSQNSELTNALVKLNKIAKILKKERFQKGAINFETNEVKFRLDENGKPLGVQLKIRKDAHKLIEEFMLLANKKVAEFVFKKGETRAEKRELRSEKREARNEIQGSDFKVQSEKTLNSKLETLNSTVMVYRVHEPPNLEKLATFAKFAARFGFNIKTDSEKGLSNSMNKMMDEVEGTAMQNVLEQLAVRTMSKARYTTEPLGHFGLAFEHYSHFTSPIRRYPDMMAHRLLQYYLTADKKAPKPDQEDFEKKSKHSSDREKLAAEAERASIKYKQVEFMSLQEQSKVYEGIITGVTDFGIFVEITETSCEGMIRLADLNDDFYEWDKENYRVVGKRTGKIFNFGDAVKVRVKATDLERRSMDFDLIEGGAGGMKVKAQSGDRHRSRSDKPKKRGSSRSDSNKDKGKRRRRK